MAKIRNRCNQVPHRDQDTNWKVTKIQENITNKRANRSALSQQVTTVLQDSMTKTNRNNKRDPQKKHRLGTVSKKITGGLKHVNMFHGTNLSLNSDVDQDT